MRFYNTQHEHYCGVDLHGRSMYLCILDKEGKKLIHRNIRNSSEYFMRVITPYRDGIVVGVESTFNWYWLADLCAENGVEFVLGHAQYMKAIHGGKAKNDRIDSKKIAVLLRGGMFPESFVYPKELRATRDLLRRRSFFVHKRAELTSHIQLINMQYNLGSIGEGARLAKNRPELPEHFADPNVRKSVEADISLVEHYTKLIYGLERHILKNTKAHDQQGLVLLQTIPGVGNILSLTILCEIYDINRFPRVQDFASYSRLVRCSHESAGKHLGSGGKKIGNVHLKWAFSEAAVICSARHKTVGAHLKKLQKKHGVGKGYSILAHKLGRAAYYMLKRGRTFDEEKFLRE